MNQHVQEIRAALTDPRGLCSALGLKGKSRQDGSKVTIYCPAHQEKTPSCSVFVGPDGTLAVNCFGCGYAGDALRLIATVHGFNEKTDFKHILLTAAEIAGLQEIINELSNGLPAGNRPPPIPREPLPDRPYPPNSELERFWTECGSVVSETAANRLLVSRKLVPDEVDRYGLAKAITSNQWLPGWAASGEEPNKKTWRFTGHRMMVPVFDSDGKMRSVRAWRVEGNSPAKRLPPLGFKANGVVMANRYAQNLLREKKGPCRILVAEGEPDFLTVSTKWFNLPVIGLTSGSWTPDFAKKIPLGSELLIMTHHDKAGDKYADIISSTVKNRAVVLRSSF
jgi:CHC2-type zinc finger protein